MLNQASIQLYFLLSESKMKLQLSYLLTYLSRSEKRFLSSDSI